MRHDHLAAARHSFDEAGVFDPRLDAANPCVTTLELLQVEVDRIDFTVEALE